MEHLEAHQHIKKKIEGLEKRTKGLEKDNEILREQVSKTLDQMLTISELIADLQKEKKG